MPARVKIGVIGLGRMGRLYAQALATQVTGAQLYAVAEVGETTRAQVESELNVPRSYADAYELIAHPDVQAVVIATPTSAHHDLAIAAAREGKAIFCEKPLALTLRETRSIIHAVESAKVPLQVGFMRRFDLAYQRAKAMIDDGQIGYPVTFKSLSRDPFCPPRNYLDPAQSGGLIIDMAIHDIDLAHWLVGSGVERVSAEGTTLVCEELASVGDIDNALVNMRFASGALGNIEASRNAFYGYDIRTEVLGSKGAVMIGAHQYTPVVLLTRAGAKHDVMPYLMERFGDAYRAQLQHFVDCLRAGETPSVGGAEAYAACKVGIAATQSYHTRRPVALSELDDAAL
ncbi:MAG TPA: inositol 2-dehydrogenase [Ktedonobacteraceae bacterium]|nr:inositol 2-dehydrogenase [Ktedonobacteraceae bacterium]